MSQVDYRKLLILTYHFPPSAASGAFRMLGFARHLPQLGWQTVIVAPPGLPWEPTDESLAGRVPSEIAAYRPAYPESWLWKPFRKLFPWGAWLPFAAANCYRAIRKHRPNAILTSGPPHTLHLLGRHLRRWTGLPWVADFRDPWVSGDPSQTNSSVPFWSARAELNVLREADAIVVNTPGARDLLSKAHPQYAAKMSSITNGFDPESFEANPLPPLSGAMIDFIHTGEVYAGRSPAPFLEALQHLDAAALGGRTPRVRFIGAFAREEQKNDAEERMRTRFPGAVVLEGRSSYEHVIRAMIQADVLLLLDTPGRRAGVPAKLYEYIGARRPILALAESESDVAWVLKESGLPYRIAPPRDVDAICRALVALLRDPVTSQYDRQNHPVPECFTRKRLAGELACLLDCLIEPSGCRIGEPPTPVDGVRYLASQAGTSRTMTTSESTDVLSR
jgi:hypothetical protein